MYDFHYNKMLKHFNRNDIDLLFTDTDSLCYHIRHTNPYEIIKANKDLYDLSNYSKEHELYDKSNNKVIRKMKNESPKYQIIEFVGLRSKCYSYRKDNNDNENKCKGVKKNVSTNNDVSDVYRSLILDNYKETLMNRTSKIIKQNTFASKKHNVSTIETYKTALSCNDDKVYILNDNINTLSHGHYKITQQ
jgi:hypothetical protein